MSLLDTTSQAASAGSAGSLLGMSNPLMLGLSVGMAGISAFSSMKQAEDEVDILGNQISSLKESQGYLDESYGVKKELATDKYTEQLGAVSYSTGQSLYDISTQGNQAISSTGLATSGTIDTNIARARDKVRDKFGFEKTGLENMLGESLLNIEEWYGASSSDLSTQMESLTYQKKQAQSRTGLGGFFKAFVGA